MSTTTRDDRRLDPSRTGSTPAAVPLVPPPKLRRRPALAAGAIIAICLGALLAVWAWTATTHTQEALAARTTIPRGSVITAGEIEKVRINADPALHPLPASAYNRVVGQHAALDIAAGGLITTDATTSAAIPPAGMSVVGISLSPAQSPALALRNGDKVRVIVTPGPNGDTSAGAPAFTSAQVVDSHTDAATGNTVVDVLVSYADASVLAARAATGNVALVLDSANSGGK